MPVSTISLPSTSIGVGDIAVGSILFLSKREHNERTPICQNPRCKGKCKEDERIFGHPAVVLQNVKNSNPKQIVFSSLTTLGQKPASKFDSERFRTFHPGNDIHSPVSSETSTDLKVAARYSFINNKEMKIQSYLRLPHTYILPTKHFWNFLDIGEERTSAVRKDTSRPADFILDNISYETLMSNIGFRKIGDDDQWDYKEYVSLGRRLGTSSSAQLDTQTPCHSFSSPVQPPPTCFIEYPPLSSSGFSEVNSLQTSDRSSKPTNRKSSKRNQ